MKKIKNSEHIENQDKPKKKISRYEIFRRIMLCICICLTVALSVQLVISIIDSIKAKKSSSEIISGVSSITQPSTGIQSGSAPIIIDKETDKVGIPPHLTRPNVETTVPESETTVPDTESIIPETTLPEPESTVPETETTPPESETTPPKSEYFSQWLENIKEMKKKYPDFVGYIRIENLDMLYPIVQAEDNSYYLDHLIDGTQNKSGEIFMDYRNNASELTDNQNIVLYGHNLGDGTKFHNLTDLRKKENYYNSPIEIITEEGVFTFTIFSFYKTDKNQDFTPISFGFYSNFGMFCIEEQKKSMYESNFKFTGKEVIITLSTCVNDFGGRWCTHAVLTNISQ